MTHSNRPTWTLLQGEDFATEAFIDAGNVVVHVTIIPRLRAEQLAHYASEGLRHVEADYQDFCRRFNYSPYSETAIHRFQEFQAWEDLDA
jgi:hypothetical protein